MGSLLVAVLGRNWESVFEGDYQLPLYSQFPYTYKYPFRSACVSPEPVKQFALQCNLVSISNVTLMKFFTYPKKSPMLHPFLYTQKGPQRGEIKTG